MTSLPAVEGCFLFALAPDPVLEGSFLLDRPQERLDLGNASHAAVRRSRVGARSSRARAPATRLRGTVASGSSAPPTERMEPEDDDDIPHEVSLFSDLIRTLLCLLSMLCMSYLWFCMSVFLLHSHTFH